MSRLIFTKAALRGVERCRSFLEERNPAASRRAAETISMSFAHMAAMPAVGRPVRGTQSRELIIPFGDTGYIALYRYDQREDAVYILAFRHQREAGYDI